MIAVEIWRPIWLLAIWPTLGRKNELQDLAPSKLEPSSKCRWYLRSTAKFWPGNLGPASKRTYTFGHHLNPRKSCKTDEIKTQLCWFPNHNNSYASRWPPALTKTRRRGAVQVTVSEISSGFRCVAGSTPGLLAVTRVAAIKLVAEWKINF